MIDHQVSKVDPTEKFLFELCDGNMIESVLMKYNYGNSVCISSQAGTWQIGYDDIRFSNA